MSFKRSSLLHSAYDELLVVGSRWRRFLAKASPQGLSSSSAKPRLGTSQVTIIPTLHIASIQFYDRVLDYMRKAVQHNKNTVIFLEGLCDSREAQEAQMREYHEIAQNESLREAMLSKADQNNLYTEDTMRDICKELLVDYDTLLHYIDEVRLQECYLKPKMAAYCGLNLHNGADLDMEKVQALLQDEAIRLSALGETSPSSVSVPEIGLFPVVRRNRERKVAQLARMQCEQWFQEGIESEVIIPWGYFHSEAIIHYITEGNAKPADEDSSSQIDVSVSQSSEIRETDHVESNLNENIPVMTSSVSRSKKDTPAAPASGRPTLVFVEADELVAKVPFGVPKDLVEQRKDTKN
ncbi:unnamed protein product [Phytomonas sp. EM1]|nr:unnamed protein product [Phytomonas sp. EM1]|eukprot:CCW64639.1 unnamed protein product [Phytomonas sp. isolate EM1]